MSVVIVPFAAGQTTVGMFEGVALVDGAATVDALEVFSVAGGL